MRSTDYPNRMRFVSRLIVITLVVVAIGGMGIHYESNVTTHWPYPTDEELATEYDTYIGETTLLFGTVKSITDDTATITVESNAGDYDLRIQSFETEVSKGGVVQVLGVIRPNRVIITDTVAVVNQDGSSRIYKYGVSLLGAALVLVLFFRYWSVNPEKRRLEADDG